MIFQQSTCASIDLKSPRFRKIHMKINQRSSNKKLKKHPFPKEKIEAETANENTWQGSVSTTTCTWRKTPSKSPVIDWLLGWSLCALAFLAVIIPCVLIATVLLAFANLLHGVSFFYGITAASLADDLFTIFVLWIFCSLIIPLLHLYIKILGEVTYFSFDISSNQMEYIFQDYFFRSRAFKIDLKSITKITPTVHENYPGNTGYFEVFLNCDDGEISLELGEGILREQLIAHSKWLSSHLGDRVAPIYHYYRDD
ncbi:MAG: hypothetical protein QM709_09835 [Spongiibacteraceae bacterium]